MAPADVRSGSTTLFDEVRNYYTKQDGMFSRECLFQSIILILTRATVPAPPPISPTFALLCAILYTVIYVAPFYLSPTLRSTPLQSRDAPAVIRARVRAVGLSCLFSTVATVYVLANYGHATPPDVARLLGFWPIDLLDIARVVGLVAVLFAGPLYETFIVDGAWRGVSITTLKDGLFENWIGYRNLVVAPASEELVFRALTIAVYLLAKVHPTRIVFTTPLIFGLAHVHHLVEFLQSRTPQGHRSPPLPVWISGIIRTLFQFTYTSLFGFFAAFVYLRTGNIWAVTLAHSFCNWMGVPRVWGRVGQFAADYEGITPDVAQGKRDEDSGGAVGVGNSLMEGQEEKEPRAAHVHSGPKDLGIGWTVVYYVLILGGAYGFYRLLWPLTKSRNALATID